MNAPWGGLADVLECEAEAVLVFARGGGRTFLAAQAAPYPFHITRPHHLDAGRPDVATIYLQSAAGGLYRGDRLGLRVEARPGAVAHVTSQAATVAHRAAERRIETTTRLEVHAGATLALTTDPYILFPGAQLVVSTETILHPNARALIAEGFAHHDPLGAGRPFSRLETGSKVRDLTGRALVDERARFVGEDFACPDGPLGPFNAFGSMVLLGGDVDPGAVEARLDAVGVLAGASRLPNDAGWSVRLLANDGGRLARGLDLLFSIGFEALTGSAPARRRK